MALRRTTASIDGTIPVKALLYDDEEIYGDQEGVGIYDGLQKAPNHQAGTAYISTHRLFYVDARNPDGCSFALDLSYITQTDYYAGLFKSSPKITFHLSRHSSTPGPSNGGDADTTGSGSWECEVCGNRNGPGLSPAAGVVVVPRASVPSPQHLSTSLPSSSVSTPPPSSVPSDSIACPACTLFNHPSLLQCEICSTDLPRPNKQPLTKSAPCSRPSSPNSDNEAPAATRMIKLSPRKGGDKPFYTVLKRCLKSKAWEDLGISGRTPVPSRAQNQHWRNIGMRQESVFPS